MKPVFDAETDEQLEKVTDIVMGVLPEINGLIQRARSGALTEHQMVNELHQLVMAHGRDFHLRLQDLVIPPPDDGRGLPRLNPPYEAALAERASFDGDVPELRFGPMPDGAVPAVPVDTNARNPVVIGSMLETASAQVAAEMVQLESETARQLEPMLDQLPVQAFQRDQVPEPIGYRRGALPALRTVAEPDAVAVAVTDEQKSAWKFISTTQGRVSAANTIATLIRDYLCQRGGMHVELPPTPMKNAPSVRDAEWTMQLSGPNATQAQFTPIDAAAAAMAQQLMHVTTDPLYICVTPINTVSDRRVGWSARLVRQ